MNDCKDPRSILFDALHQPVLVIDRNYSVVDANLAASHYVNRTREGIIGETCFGINHGKSVPCWQSEGVSCPVKSAFENRAQARVLHSHVHGRLTIIEEVVASPLFDESGNVKLVVEELRDVTELLGLREVIEHLKGELKTLHGIIPICASCKKIRDERGRWMHLENYFRMRTEADFTHSICPDCLHRLYPRFGDGKE